VVKVRKKLVNASISGFYQTISVNAGICQHLFVKVRNDLELVCFCGNYILRFLISSIKISDMRKRFYDVLSESMNNKKDNNFYLSSERYNSLLREVKEAKRVKGKQTVHYWRLKRYDILNIGGEEKLTVPLSAEKTEILYYVAFDELFNVIHEAR
jgi:hypothetical protein